MPLAPQNPQNIAILGAGIMGLSVAYRLAEAGFPLTIYDPDIAQPRNASSMAGGMLSPLSECEHMDTDWIAAGFHGIALWEEISARLSHAIGFHRRGSLITAHEQDRYILNRFQAHLPAQFRWHTLSSDKQRTLEPGLGHHIREILYMETEAHLNPPLALAALRQRIQEDGAAILAESIDLQTAQEKHDLVIDCRGMGAAADDPDLRGVVGEILIVHNPECRLTRPVRLMHPRYPLYIVPQPGDIFLIGATMIESGNADPVHSAALRSAMELMGAAYALDKSFAEAKILSLQAGIRPAYPDNLPRLTVCDRLIRANGLFRHGYLLAPVMAACIVNHLQGQENSFMSLFRRHPDETDHQRPTANLHHAA